MTSEIMVSVICNTYNHARYIEKAIVGFLEQEVSFEYEILLHDDASTDETAEIIKKYELLYPGVIKALYQKDNQYSKGIDINEAYQYPRVNGRYIAFCEGDDYWTDKLKLQKQVDAMERHKDINICSHSSIAVKANTGKKLFNISPAKNDCIFKVEDVVRGGGGFVATNSLMIRSCIISKIPEYYRFLPIDYALQIQGSHDKGMLYLSDVMSAYRIMADNSWSLAMRNNPKKRLEINKKIVQMLRIFNSSTARLYESTVVDKIDEIEYWDLYYSGKYREMKNNKIRYKKLSIKDKCIINCKLFIPQKLIILKRKIF